LSGATKLEQWMGNLASLDFTIPQELRAKLTQAAPWSGRIRTCFFGEAFQGMIQECR
jgi:hypothetical protein